MHRMLPALFFAILIHAIVLTVDSSWLKRQASIAPKAQVINMRLVERAPQQPAVIRALPAPPVPLPNPQQQPVQKKTVVQKPAQKKQLVIPKPKAPKPRQAEPTQKRLPAPSLPPPAPMLASVQPSPEPSEPSSAAIPLQSENDLPLLGPASESPAKVEAAATAPATKTTAVATVVMATPRYSDNPPPAYPSIARNRGYEGTVVLQVFVREDGSVGDLKVGESSSHRMLDRSAVKAVSRWQFEPGMQAGKTVAMWVRVPVKFSLQ